MIKHLNKHLNKHLMNRRTGLPHSIRCSQFCGPIKCRKCSKEFYIHNWECPGVRARLFKPNFGGSIRINLETKEITHVTCEPCALQNTYL